MNKIHLSSGSEVLSPRVYDEEQAEQDANEVGQLRGVVHVVGIFKDEGHFLVVSRKDVVITPEMLVSDLEKLSCMDTDNTCNTVFLKWKEITWNVEDKPELELAPGGDLVSLWKGKQSTFPIARNERWREVLGSTVLMHWNKEQRQHFVAGAGGGATFWYYTSSLRIVYTHS